jgi:1-acyl-sn-glycerol-3-phosphate acyltransferase
MWQAIARLLLRLGGWTAVGGPPEVPKAVVIAVPHTSNWDGYWGIVYKVAVRLEVHWFAKQSLFWFPLGTLLRFFGGIPLDRKRAGSAVDVAVDLFGQSDSLYFALAPEGISRLRPRARALDSNTGKPASIALPRVPAYPLFSDFSTTATDASVWVRQ